MFGLGYDNIIVLSQTITSTWFKGRELVTAFGLTLSLLRLGSFINGPLIEHLATNYSVGFSFMVGFCICVFSLLAGIVLVLLDVYAERKNLEKAEDAQNQTHKFRVQDLKEFKFPFWISLVSLITYYCSKDVYIANSADMLTKNFGFSESEAAFYYTIPYIFLAVAAPFTGLLADRVG